MSASQSGRGRKPLILTALFLVLLLGAYGYGRWQGVESARGRYQPAAIAAGARTERVQSTLTQLEDEARSLRHQVRLLQARRRLHLALMALDARNFGIARDHLNRAGKDLEALPSDPAAGDNEALSRLSRELSSALLTAGDDLSTHRQRILAWIQELEKQLPTVADGSPTSEADVSGNATSPDEPVGTETKEMPAMSPEVQSAAPGSDR